MASSESILINCMAPSSSSLLTPENEQPWDASPNGTSENGHEKLKHYNIRNRVLSSDTEKRKVALKHGYLSAALHSLVHVPSIAITAGVLSLTFRTVFWGPPGPNTNSILNALQFAAKVHEAFIFLSLGAIVTYYVRHDLISSRGVPLGLLSSGLQVNSAAYIFSREFWNAATAKSGIRQISLVFIILAAFFLAALASPSSAITMIPALNWWQVEHLWPGNSIVFSAYIKSPNATLYPETVTKDHLPNYCFGENATSHADCPSAGLSALVANTQFLTNTDPSFWIDGFLSGINITMSSVNGNVMRFLGGTSSPIMKGTNSVYAASSISDFLGMAIYNYYTTVSGWRVPSVNDVSPLDSDIQRPLLRMSLSVGNKLITAHKPAVQVECGASTFGTSNITFPHDLFMTNPWTDGDFESADWFTPISAISDIAVDDVSGKVNFTWVEVGQAQSPTPSLAGIFVMPRFNPGAGNNNSIYSCTIGANWMPTEPWIDPSTDKFLHEALPQPFGDISYDITGPGGIIPTYLPLYIDPTWANSLNVNLGTSDTPQTAMEMIGSACATSTGSGKNSTVEMAMTQCLEMALALYIADGLSRMQSSFPTYFIASGPDQVHYTNTGDLTALTPQIQDLNVGSITFTTLYPNITLADLQDPTRYTAFSFEVLKYGYGYGFNGLLIYLAIAVLLIHALAAVIHVGIVLSRGISSDAWSTMGEITALALNSSIPDQMQNTGAGVSMKTTWRLVAKVRASTDKKVELVFGDHDVYTSGVDDKYSLLQPGRKYG